MELSDSRALMIVALLGSILCLAIAPAALPEGYSVVEHTTSQAAAQATEGAWIARTGSLLFGLAVFCLGLLKRGWPSSARLLHATFGVLLIAAAVYSQRSYLEDVDYDTVEDMLHSIAVSAIGVAFAAGVLVVGWRRIPRWKLIDAMALLGAVAIPIAMVATDGVDGLLERAVLAIAYVWYGLEMTETQRRTSFDTIG